jgi:hypothetical protein
VSYKAHAASKQSSYTPQAVRKRTAGQLPLRTMNLRFLSRIAFICNLCLLLSWPMRYYSFIQDHALQSTIIIAGMVLSFFMNGLVNILYAVLLIRKKPLAAFVPVWLVTINFLFLIFQLYIILFG